MLPENTIMDGDEQFDGTGNGILEPPKLFLLVENAILGGHEPFVGI